MAADYNEDPYQHIVRSELYTPSVFFDGATFLFTPALAAGSGGRVTLSFWAKLAVGDHHQLIGVANPFGDGPEDVSPFGFGFNQFVSPTTFIMSSSEVPFFEEPEAGSAQDFIHSTYPMAYGVWHHVCATLITTVEGRYKPAQVYVDGVPGFAQIDFNPDIDYSRAYTMRVSGRPFYVGGPVQHFNGDLSELWVAFDQYLNLDDIANRRKFLAEDGSPVPLGSSGELPTGVPPTIFGHGDKDTFMQPNLGTGGGFSLTGALGNASSIPRLG